VPETGRPSERTLSDLLREGAAALGSSPSPALEAKVLLLKAARLSEEEFFRAPSAPASKRVEADFRRLLGRRLAGVPIAYITGEKEFWSLKLRVARSVLIPRPETEVLVEKVLELARRDGELILDVGTGSGNLAVALAKEMPRSTVYAVDVSLRALKVARSNALRHRLGNIVFVRSDLFSAFRGRGLKFDFIVSNPPYVARGEWEELPEEIRAHEPRRALLAGLSGLEVIERLVRRSRFFLKPGGYLIFEIGDGQRDRVLELFDGRWREIETAWDLAGRARVITARRA
jgi:release factor glutamine methyltransferase